MAVSVDTVYQRVLALANKEQRGYITPQEFNLLANQAQLSIFESYFYSRNQRDRLEPDVGIETDETDISELISKKLGPFVSFENVGSGHTYPTDIVVDGASYPIYQTGRVFYGNELCQRINIGEARRYINSTRHMLAPSTAPIYTDDIVSGRDILVYAGSSTAQTSMVTVECFRKPVTVEWAYVVVNGKALYNANLAVDFELHPAEEDTLVNLILEMAGIIINKAGIANIAKGLKGEELGLQAV